MGLWVFRAAFGLKRFPAPNAGISCDSLPVRMNVAERSGDAPGMLLADATSREMSWSGRPGSNRRHSAWEADVLPLNYSRPWDPLCSRGSMPDETTHQGEYLPDKGKWQFSVCGFGEPCQVTFLRRRSPAPRIRHGRASVSAVIAVIVILVCAPVARCVGMQKQIRDGFVAHGLFPEDDVEFPDRGMIFMVKVHAG